MYDEFLTVNKKFRSSVNLQYDLNNEEKIEQYVPTTDLCDVIKSYVKNVITNNNKASILAGPYGKGKSYLMLMIIYIFSKNKKRITFNRIVSKIRKIDDELANLIEEVDSKKIYLLPVIVNGSNYDDINQNFMLALKTSLIDNSIGNIIPKTTFNECLDLLNQWENTSDSDFNIINKCINSIDVSIVELRHGLENYDIVAYKQFEELFFCISHGYSFNPLVGNDIGEIYEDVSRELSKKDYGEYKGIFTVFDEFGVFLGNQTSNFISRLNKIQAFAEKCNSSDANCQLHLCCITHKDIKLYNKSDNFYTDQFETISGRFKQYRFDRSLDENYQIICSALEKKPGYSNLVDTAYEQNKDFINSLKDSNIFNSEQQVDYIFNNGYPFNPISLYALIQVSEKVAQNERTLFTFISDVDANSFNYFISNRSESLLNVPMIYDYFEELIHNNETYKSLYYKVESLKRLSVKEEERSIFKVIAIIKMIDDDIKLNSSVKNIALCLNLDTSNIDSIVSKLINENILKQNMNDHTIDFTVIADNETNNLIDNLIIQKYSACKISELLSIFDKNKYFISNKYNFDYKMTRFYKSLYLEGSALKQLNDLGTLFIGEECDGIIINLVNDCPITQTEIKKVLSSSPYKNIIVRYNDKNISEYAIDKLKKVFAAKTILDNSKVSESIRELLPLLISDLTEELNTYLKEFYLHAKCLNSINYSEKNLKECINLSLSNYYSKTIVLNNEQVNKNIISSTTAKSRNIIVDALLRHQEINFGQTSAEATIYSSFLQALENKQNPNIINLISEWIINSNGEKKSCVGLIELLRQTPYGIRNGVIPLFIAKAIGNLSIVSSTSIDTVILYNDTNEIELSSNNIAKIVSDSHKYSFCYTRINNSKLKMTKALLEIFGCEVSLSFAENISCLTKRIKVTIANLSPTIIKTSKKENILALSDLAIDFKELFLKHDLNNYDVLFKQMPMLLNKDYNDIPLEINKILNEYDTRLKDFSNKIIIGIIEKFNVSNNSIKSSFDLWKSKYSYIDKIVFDGQAKNLYNAFKQIKHNNIDSLNNLSYAVLNCTIDDWSVKKQEVFFTTLDSLIYTADNYSENDSISREEFQFDSDAQLSNLGKTLYTNILDSIDEYGGALTNEEKAIVLKKILNEIIN